MQHVVVFKDRFEHFDDKTCAMRRMVPRMVTHVDEVLEVRIQDGGFILRLVADCLTVRVPTALEAQAWADVLWIVFDPNRLKQRKPEEEEMPSDRRFTALWSQNDLLPEQASMTAARLQHQLTGSRMDVWAAGLKDHPHHYGVLGFQSQGKLANRYCVLFEDRLDMWEDPAAAVSGRRPLDRIVLKSIRSLETVFGGFVIHLGGGKRKGVHVNSKEELREWSAALSGVVISLGHTQPSGGTGGNPHSPRRTRPNQEADAIALTARPVARSPDWLPRVATLAVKPRLASGDSPQAERSLSPRKTFFSARSGGKNFTCNTHPNAVMLNKDYARVSTTTVHPENEVTDKISTCNDSQRQPRLPKKVWEDIKLTGKVSGGSHDLSPRRQRPSPGDLTWVKCNQPEGTPKVPQRSQIFTRPDQRPPYAASETGPWPTPPGRTTSLRRNGSAPAPITEKINQPYYGRTASPCKPRMPGKVTDRSREAFLKASSTARLRQPSEQMVY